jgi:ATP-dependent protease ClpP protease subunit
MQPPLVRSYLMTTLLITDVICIEIIEKTLERDFFMTAEEALKFGVIDKILERRDSTQVIA